MSLHEILDQIHYRNIESNNTFTKRLLFLERGLTLVRFFYKGSSIGQQYVLYERTPLASVHGVSLVKKERCKSIASCRLSNCLHRNRRNINCAKS
jgi:hypothetical protein